MRHLLPDRTAPLRVLLLGAHADDIEIGCGGTVLRLLRERPDCVVRWVVFSGHGPRAEEARTSAQRFLAGARDALIDIYQFRDGYYPYQGAAIKECFEALKPFAPDMVFTHYRDDRHQDHREISNLTWNTWRSHMVLEYEIPKYDGDLATPNVYVPLDADTCRQKVTLLQDCFPTQRGKQWFDAETFMALLRLRGLECDAPGRYAEAFYGRKLTLGL